MNKIIRIPLKSWYDSLSSGTFNWSMFMHYIVDSINAETDDTFKVKYCEYRSSSTTFYTCIALPLANKANVQTSLRPVIYQASRDRANTSTSSATISNIVSGLFVDDTTIVWGGNTGQKSISAGPYPTSNISFNFDLSPLYNAFVISINTDYLDTYGFYLVGYGVDYSSGSYTPVSAITQELLVGTCKEYNTDKTYNYYTVSGSGTSFQILEGETELSKNNSFGLPGGRFNTIIGDEVEISDFKMMKFYDENLKYIDNSNGVYQNKFAASNLGKYPSGVIPKIMKIDGVDYDGLITNNKPKFIVPSK